VIHCLTFPERLNTTLQEDDEIFICTAILLLKRRVPSDFCTRRMHTGYVRKRNGFPAYVVMSCNVMFCTSVKYLDLHLFLPPPFLSAVFPFAQFNFISFHPTLLHLPFCIMSEDLITDTA